MIHIFFRSDFSCGKGTKIKGKFTWNGVHSKRFLGGSESLSSFERSMEFTLAERMGIEYCI